MWWLWKKIAGHVFLNWSKGDSEFSQFTNHYIRVEVTGMRVNRGVELGLEIPVNYFFWRYKNHDMGEN